MYRVIEMRSQAKNERCGRGEMLYAGQRKKISTENFACCLRALSFLPHGIAQDPD
jgi:hypothetical protein